MILCLSSHCYQLHSLLVLYLLQSWPNWQTEMLLSLDWSVSDGITLLYNSIPKSLLFHERCSSWNNVLTWEKPINQTAISIVRVSFTNQLKEKGVQNLMFFLILKPVCRSVKIYRHIVVQLNKATGYLQPLVQVTSPTQGKSMLY